MDLKNKYPDKAPQTASRLIDGEAVIVVPQKDEVKVLNEVGSIVWELLDGRNTIGQMAKVISEEFEISPENAEKDIVDFLCDLYEKDMVILLDEPRDEDQ